MEIKQPQRLGSVQYHKRKLHYTFSVSFLAHLEKVPVGLCNHELSVFVSVIGMAEPVSRIPDNSFENRNFKLYGGNHEDFLCRMNHNM